MSEKVLTKIRVQVVSVCETRIPEPWPAAFHTSPALRGEAVRPGNAPCDDNKHATGPTWL